MKTLIIIVAGGALLFAAGLGGGTLLALKRVQPAVEEIAEARRKAAEEAAAAKEAEERARIYLRTPDPAHLDPDHLRSVARELERWNADLTARETRIQQLETDLARREELARRERAALDAQRAEIAAFQRRIADSLIVIEDRVRRNLEQQLELLNAMRPEQVVDILREQPEAQAARLLSQMKTRRVVKLVETWNAMHPEERNRVLDLLEAMRLVTHESDIRVEGETAATPATP
jgi:hypothetical protein